jgi:arylsulfatase A-like enzyme
MRLLLPAIFVLTATAAEALGAPAPEGERPLNVLFLMSDDMRPALGCYGDSIAKSPHIDALAREGVRFEQAYCQYPLCNPSRTSMLTGRYPVTSGVLDNTAAFRKLHPDWVTLPEHFKNNGYASLRTGKIFHGGIDDPQSWTAGGEARRSGPRPQVNREERRRRSDRIVVLEGDGESHGDFQTADRAIEFLREYRDRPFFLACGFTKPHSPPTAPQKYFDLYDAGEIPLPETFAARPAAPDGFPRGAITSNGDLFIGREASEDEARRMLQAYYASVSWTDANVGRVVAELDRLGLRERTVVVFWGDHGYHLGEFGKWAKHGSLFETGTRVPLIIAAPGAKANGMTVAAPVEALDIYPTLCELCGLPTPAGVEGNSLEPLLDNPAAAWDHPAYSVAGNLSNLGVAVRSGRYRYAEWSGGKNGSMLIDVTADPHEMTNLVDDVAHAEARERLAGLARDHAGKLEPAQ